MEKWFRQTEAMLYEHKILCAELNAWLAEQTEQILSRSYVPSMFSAPYGSSGQVSKPTETFAILRASFPDLPDEVRDKYVQAQQIQAAIGAMTALERRIYKLKYVEERADVDIWIEMDIAKATYYRHRKHLVSKVAGILGLKRLEKMQ